MSSCNDGNNNNNNNNNNQNIPSETGGNNNNNNKNSSSFLDRFWNSSIFGNNEPVDWKQQIHEELNQEEERRKLRKQQQDAFLRKHWLFGRNNTPNPKHDNDKHDNDHDNDFDDLFQNAHQQMEEMIKSMMNPSSSASSSNNNNHQHSSSSYSSSSYSSSSSPFLLSSSYQMRQDHRGVEIAVSLPKHAQTAKDVQVQVLQMEPSCVIQWSTPRNTNNATTTNIGKKNVDKDYYFQRSFGMRQETEEDEQQQQQNESRNQQRLRLGSSVDCEQLSANISKGMLQLSAPNKNFNPSQTNEKPRLIPITEKND